MPNAILNLTASQSFLANQLLSKKKYGILDKDKIIEVIKKHGLLYNLVLFHFNKITYIKDIEEILSVIYKEGQTQNLIYCSEKILSIVNYHCSEIGNIEHYNYLTLLDLAYALINAKIITPYLLCRIFNILRDSENYEEDDLLNLLAFYQKVKLFDKTIDTLLYTAKTLARKEYEVKIINNKRFLIAYKGVNKDFTSTQTDYLTYEPGNIYYADSCDSRDIESNSFGLSAWYYDDAKRYCAAHIVKVRIAFDDIRYINPLDGKIRAIGFEVLETVE